MGNGGLSGNKEVGGERREVRDRTGGYQVQLPGCGKMGDVETGMMLRGEFDGEAGALIAGLLTTDL
jgi:hypothetical protein